jgi:hypothetical protein
MLLKPAVWLAMLGSLLHSAGSIMMVHTCPGGWSCCRLHALFVDVLAWAALGLRCCYSTREAALRQHVHQELATNAYQCSSYGCGRRWMQRLRCIEEGLGRAGAHTWCQCCRCISQAGLCFVARLWMSCQWSSCWHVKVCHTSRQIL